MSSRSRDYAELLGVGVVGRMRSDAQDSALPEAFGGLNTTFRVRGQSDL